MTTALDQVRISAARAHAAQAAGITVDQLLANEAGLTLAQFVALRQPPDRRFFRDSCRACDGHGRYGRLGHTRCPECG